MCKQIEGGGLSAKTTNVVDAHYNFSVQTGVTADFLEISPHLGALLTVSWGASIKDITLCRLFLSELANPASCSFVSTFTVEEFLDSWRGVFRVGFSTREIFSARADFSYVYWSHVYDLAQESIEDCRCAFHLPLEIVKTLHGAPSRLIGAFCRTNPLLHRFRLAFDEKECERIYAALSSGFPKSAETITVNVSYLREVIAGFAVARANRSSTF